MAILKGVRIVQSYCKKDFPAGPTVGMTVRLPFWNGCSTSGKCFFILDGHVSLSSGGFELLPRA